MNKIKGRGASPHLTTRVMLSILRGNYSHDEIHADTGIARAAIWRAIQGLSAEGMIHYTPGRQGTIRPAVGIVVGATLLALNKQSLS